MSLFNELKRRNVFRIGIAYGITTWLIAQIAGLAADSFMAPDWVMKMIITILILGFPVALVMAWAYEMTPEGLRRESDIEPGQSVAQVNANKLDRTITIALLVAVAYFSYDKFILDPRRDAALLETASRHVTETIPKSPAVASEPEQAEQVPSIAVLSFVNMSDDAGNEYFAEGLSEELLNLLVRIPELKVAARTSSFSYRGKDVKIAQIGEELNVAHVLEGSVRKSGNRVRITVQLTKADDGFDLWSKTYDRTLDDIFVTQDEIAVAVVEALKVSLLGAVPEVRPTDTEVYSLYLQGRYFDNLKGKDNLEKAVTAYQQALAIDPDYAPAWIGINVAYGEQAKYGWRTPEQAYSLSMAAVERALAIDDNMANAWASLAYLRRNQWDWTGAKVAIDKALQLEPNNVFVIGSAATLAGTFGRLEESVELFEKIVSLNPLSMSSLRALGIRYANVGRLDKALETFNRVKKLNPDFPGIHINLGVTYLWQGDAETALLEFEKNPTARFYSFQKARVLSTLGREAEALEIINELLVSSAHEEPTAMASTFAWRGENDLAFEWLEVAWQQRSGSLAIFLGIPWNKNLESDPRYAKFLEKLGLLEDWKAMSKPGDKT